MDGLVFIIVLVFIKSASGNERFKYSHLDNSTCGNIHTPKCCIKLTQENVYYLEPQKKSHKDNKCSEFYVKLFMMYIYTTLLFHSCTFRPSISLKLLWTCTNFSEPTKLFGHG